MGFFSKNTADATIRVNYKGDNAKKGLSTLKKTIATVITAAVVKQMVSYSLELGKLGAQAELVNKNFENMAKKQGRSVDTMMAKMKKATLGMVDDMTLQQNAMKAMISGVDFDDMIVAMEYVTKYAAATGADVNQKMTTVMTGFARKSAMFMDDVGIQVMGAEDVIAATVDQMKEKMDQFAMSEEDAAVAGAQLKADMENLRIEVGQALVPVLSKLIPITRDIANGFREIFTGMAEASTDRANATIEEVKQLVELRGEWQAVMDMQLALQSQGGTLFNPEALQEAKDNIESINESIKDINKGVQDGGAGAVTGTGDGDKEKKKKSKADIEREKENEKTSKWLDNQIAITEKYGDDANAITQEQWEERNDIINAALRTGQDENLRAHQERLALLEYQKQLYPELTNEINTLIGEENDAFRASELEKERALQQEKIDNFRAGLSTATSITSALMQLSDARTNREIENLENQNLSEKDFQKKKEQILQDAEEKRRVYARVQQGIAIAEATVNAIKMGTGAGADTPGGAITRGLAMAAAIAAGMVEVATIEAQNFQTGRIGKRQTSRQSDDILAMVGQGETIIPAPQSAQHEDTLRAIANNTANTAAGIGSTGGGVVTNQFYGVSTEQVLQVISQSNRRHNVGVKL